MTASSLLGKRAGARSYRRPSRTRACEDCWIGALGVAAPAALYRHGPTLPPSPTEPREHCPHEWEKAIRSRSGEFAAAAVSRQRPTAKVNATKQLESNEVTGPRRRAAADSGRSGVGRKAAAGTKPDARSRPMQRLGRSRSRSLRLLLRRAREGCRAGVLGVMAT